MWGDKYLSKKPLVVTCIGIIVIIFFLIGCSALKPPTIVTPTTKMIPSTAVLQTLTPVGVIPTAGPTQTANMGIFDLRVTISVTQRSPVIHLDITPQKENLLYQDMLVTFKLGPESSPSGYLNLDDVTNNSVANSDIVLQVITGTKSIDYDLYVTNRARYYLTDNKDLDLSSCLKFFPLSGFTYSDYLIQALMFVSGDSYCVLTNEGRIAIVSFVKDSINFNDDGTLDISIKVSTYKPQYTSLLDATAETTPTLTRTLYMTPTLCVNNWQSEMEARYDSTGISACLAREVENTMHAFVTAVKNGDKEAITTLVEYPVLMANNENDVWASNEEEFLAGYDLIFTPDIVARISRAKMDDVMGGDFLTGVYWPVRDGADGYITFTPKGKIQVISFYGIK